MAEIVSTIIGDSPLVHIPSDYYPENKGFWYRLPSGLDAGKKMFYRNHTVGDGNPQATIVFVHGNPECSYSYRKTIRALEARARRPCRLIAMDHIGFGLSDQATYPLTAMDHAANLIQFVRFLDLQQVTLVVHDWGGPIGIGAFLNEPERVDNVIVLNTTVFPMPATGFTYHGNYPIRFLPWVKFPSVFPDRIWGSAAAYAVYRRPAGPVRLLCGALVHVLLSEMGLDFWGERYARRVYREQFRSRVNAKSSKHLVRQTAVWGTGGTYRDPLLGVRDTRGFYAGIQQQLTDVWGPAGRYVGARGLFGSWDPVGKSEVIDQWRTHLPQLDGHIQVFGDVGHFINIEKPEPIAAAILDVTGLA